MKQNFNQENETPLFEGQPIDQTEITNEVENKEVEEVLPTEELQTEMSMQQAEPLEFIQETPISQTNEFTEETQQYQTPLFTQTFPQQETPVAQASEFVEETQQYQTPFSQTPQQETPFVQPQTNTLFQGAAQEKPKSKKKLIVGIVSAVIVLVLLVLGGLYGYSVYTKSQALETVKNEKNSIKKKSDELQVKVTKYESLNNMKKFEVCISDKAVGSGKAFTLSTSKYDGIQIVEKSSSTIEEELKRCKEKVENVKLDGAKELIDSEIQKIGETYQANTKFIEEAKTAQKQWTEFKSAWKTGTVEESEFNRIRALAATAIGVEPSTLGTHLLYSDISSAFDRRMKAIESKQTVRNGEEIRSFISKNLQEGETESKIEDLYQDKQNEFQKIKKELDQKEKEVKEKESKVWNPFQ